MKKRFIIPIIFCMIITLVVSLGFVKKNNMSPEKVYLHASWANYYETFAELKAESDIIAVVEIKEVKNQYTVGDIPMTNFLTVVSEPIYGVEDSEEVVVVQTGGIINNQLFQIEDDPLMTPGEKYLIFGEKNDLGTITILGGPQGRYSYSEGKITNIFTTEINISNTRNATGSSNFLSPELNCINQDLNNVLDNLK